MELTLRLFEATIKDLVAKLELMPDEAPSLKEILPVYLNTAELGGAKTLPIRIRLNLKYIHSRWKQKTLSSVWTEYTLGSLVEDLYKKAVEGEVITTNPDNKAFIVETAELSYYISQMQRKDSKFRYNNTEKLKCLGTLYKCYCNEKIESPMYLEDVYKGILVNAQGKSA